MKPLRAIYACVLVWLALPAGVLAQRQPDWEIEALPGREARGVVYDFQTGIATATNGVMVRYGTAVLTAEQVAVNQNTGEVVADGQVRIQQGDQVWVSEHIRYNVKTREIQAEQFRTGQALLFAEGLQLHADVSNRVYTATNALVTPDDVENPLVKIRARKVVIHPGDKVVAYDAVLLIGKVPVFWFPYYSRKLGDRANNFTFTPGYRGSYGPFILGSYNFFLGEELDGTIHGDYRGKRGPGVGPDLNYHFGQWGEGTVKYYYTHDQDPSASGESGVAIPADRQRVWFSYRGEPATNLQVLSMVRYQSDVAVVRDFFQGEYRQNPQPNTFVEVNRFWNNWSVDTYVEPQVNRFLETVERLPEVRLTGYRQELGSTPFYYESVSSAGWYTRQFATDAGIYTPSLPGTNYSAARADTFHQVLLPHTFFGWLNVIPRAGGRFTYYGQATGPGAFTEEEYRGVFNTGAEVSTKASRVWPEIKNSLLDMNGMRHILEPAVNYAYVPSPNVSPSEVPKFDYQMTSLRLLPIDFPDYNSIDSIDAQNVIRLGLRNRLQTKRRSQVADLVNWDLYTDWRLDPQASQDTFSDVFSDLAFRPRSWLLVESLLRFDVADADIRMALTSLRFQPNNIWSWGISHYFLRKDLTPSPDSIVGLGNNTLSSTLFVRLNEDWGLRAAHRFQIPEGVMQEQMYSVYRDLRSWTAALAFIVQKGNLGQDDFGVAFTFSLKAWPRFHVGGDTVAPFSLLGS